MYMVKKIPFDQKIIAKIKKVLEKEPEVLAAYLFGSQAQGYASTKSDFDIGLIIKDETKIDYSEIYSKLSEQIKNKDIDIRLINIKNFDPLFAFNVIKPNLCLYKKSESDRIAIEKKIMKTVFDTQHMRDIYHYYLDESFKEGGFGYGVKFNN